MSQSAFSSNWCVLRQSSCLIYHQADGGELSLCLVTGLEVSFFFSAAATTETTGSTDLVICPYLCPPGERVSSS